jgi:hypothetical protein
MNRVPLEKLVVDSMVKKFPASYWSTVYILLFKTVSRCRGRSSKLSFVFYFSLAVPLHTKEALGGEEV